MTKHGMGYMVTYKEPGTYSFTCRVTDNHNLKNSGSTTVTVKSGKNIHIIAHWNTVCGSISNESCFLYINIGIISETSPTIC